MDIDKLSEIMHRTGKWGDAQWMEDADINLILHEAKQQGLIRRLSVTQVEWTDKGMAVLNQVDKARDVLDRLYRGKVAGMDAVITSKNLSGVEGRETYGFHFEREGTVKPGDVIQRTDGTRATVECVL